MKKQKSVVLDEAIKLAWFSKTPDTQDERKKIMQIFIWIKKCPVLDGMVTSDNSLDLMPQFHTDMYRGQKSWRWMEVSYVHAAVGLGNLYILLLHYCYITVHYVNVKYYLKEAKV